MKRVIFAAVAAILLFAINANALSTISYFFNSSSQNDTQYNIADLIHSSSLMLQIDSDKETNCKYSLSDGLSYDSMEGSFEYNLGTRFKKSFSDLDDGVHRIYIKCRDSGGYNSGELTIMFGISAPVSAEISLSREQPLGAGKAKVKIITSKSVSETPTLSYSFDGINYNPLPLSGEDDSWSGYISVPASAGDTVLSFKFSGRDIEGYYGEEIKSGRVFTVDTIKPDPVSEIEAIGSDGSITINWHLADDADHYVIYKSTMPQTDYTSPYKTVYGDSYTDNLVERGKTYYYRVTSVDEAGNEAELSKEVYATPTLSNLSSAPSGLDLSLASLVDVKLSDIDSMISSINDVKSKFGQLNDKEKQVYTDLKLESDITGALSEINSLRKDVERYKTQNLNKDDLEKKLNLADLKMNTLKTKIPENIVIVSEKNENKGFDETSLANAILQIEPGISDSLKNYKIARAMDEAKNSNFKNSISAFQIVVSYLDGTRKEMSLVKEKIDSTLERNENLSFAEIIPKDIADSVSAINFMDSNYEVLKEDPIVSYSTDTKEISYTLDKNIDMSRLKDISLVILFNGDEPTGKNIFTGYAIAGDILSSGKGIFWIFIIAVSIFGIYFLYLKRLKRKINSLKPISDKIANASSAVSSGNIAHAKKIYALIAEEYKKLPERDRKALYPRIKELYAEIKSFS